MDGQDLFFRDSVATVRSIGREWALPRRHDPPGIRKYSNRDTEKERRPPGGEQKPSPEPSRRPLVKNDAEGFEITI
jgi:hypothetical protein